jgi:[acyl-carrier-protein] S-malonyltransferase
MHAFAVLCPGQGTQSESMFDVAIGSDLGVAVVDAFSVACGEDLVARARLGDRLFANAFAQPAMVATACATWAALRGRLPDPALFAGYSVGELSAWACAGAWAYPDAARVTIARATAMDRLSPPDCGMLAVRGLPASGFPACVPGLDVAIVNESDHVVLAGPVGLLDAAEPVLVARGAWTRRLDVHVPSHTPAMAAAAAAFGDAATLVETRSASSRVLGGIDGVARTRGPDAIATLGRAIRETIRWDACMNAINESGVRVALELGPGRSLANLCQANCPDVSVRSVSDFRTIDGVIAWMLRELET